MDIAPDRDEGTSGKVRMDETIVAHDEMRKQAESDHGRVRMMLEHLQAAA